MNLDVSSLLHCHWFALDTVTENWGPQTIFKRNIPSLPPIILKPKRGLIPFTVIPASVTSERPWIAVLSVNEHWVWVEPLRTPHQRTCKTIIVKKINLVIRLVQFMSVLDIDRTIGGLQRKRWENKKQDKVGGGTLPGPVRLTLFVLFNTWFTIFQTTSWFKY